MTGTGKLRNYLHYWDNTIATRPSHHCLSANDSVGLIRVLGNRLSVCSKALWHHGYRYYLNYKKLPGSPDIAIKKHNIAVFVDGEFWHGQDWDRRKTKLKRNRDYWIEKIEENIARNEKVDIELRQQGWIPIHLWSKNVLKDLNGCIEEINQVANDLSNDYDVIFDEEEKYEIE